MILKVAAQIREIERKKSSVKNLRKSGNIPAVIYGSGEEAKHVTLEKISFMKSYKKSIGETALFYVSVDGKEIHTIIKSRQMHPVTREIVHVDFLEFHPGRPITIDIPLSVTGEPEGVKLGGNLDVLMHKLPVSCLPKDIPEAIEIDVSALNIGDSIHVADLSHEKFTFNIADDITLVIVHAPRKADEEETDDDDDATDEVTEEVTED
ncbi:MAG: 50S ribosomal protein L25 [Candidatus Zophobacter franzmannii]|jgi:large subunit ribosomal protein L25|nr:50S ribosomal protein L25 [Candidatus Zophobacter franzmannii]